MRTRLTVEQEKRLNRLYLSAEVGGGSWRTIEVLLRKGMVEERDGRLLITEAGRAYCQERGSSMPL